MRRRHKVCAEERKSLTIFIIQQRSVLVV